VAAGIALPGTSPEKLAVDPAGFVAAGGNDMQSPFFGDAVSQGNISAASSHVGGHGYLAFLAGLGDNRCLFFVLPGIEYLVGNAGTGEFLTQYFRVCNRSCTDQNRAAVVLVFFDRCQNSLPFFLCPGKDPGGNGLTLAGPVQRGLPDSEHVYGPEF